MRSILLILMVFVALPAVAAEVDGLYSATVPVASQSPTDREQGVRIAFGEVLIKLTGDTQIARRNQASQAISEAQRYVASIGYRELHLADSQEEESEPQMGLEVSFAPHLVDQLIRRSQLSVWPANRPQLLVWLVADGDQGRQYVGSGSDNPIREHLKRELARRGLSFAFPDYDLQDQLKLPPDNIWALNGDQLAEASERYGASHWVALRFLTTYSGQLRGAWLSGSEGRLKLDDASAESHSELAEAVALSLVETIAPQFTYVPQASSSGFLLQVSGVGSFKFYRQALSEIADLEPVVSHKLLSVDGDKLELEVEVEGSLQLFEEALLRNGHFRLNPAPVIYEPVRESAPEPAVESEPQPEGALTVQPLEPMPISQQPSVQPKPPRLSVIWIP